MKKKLKRVFAVVMAICIVMMYSVTAMAAPPDPNSLPNECADKGWFGHKSQWALIENESVDPTCETEGEYHYKCTKNYVNTRWGSWDCSSRMKITVEPLGHDFENGTVISNTATCTTDGVKTIKCSRCDTTTTAQVNALDHDFENGNVIGTTDAKCKEAGTKTTKCSRCEETKTVTVGEALGHDFENGTVVETKNPNCTDNGYEKVKCSRCEEYDIKEIRATGHSFKNYVKDESGATLTAVCDHEDCDATDVKGVKEGSIIFEYIQTANDNVAVEGQNHIKFNITLYDENGRQLTDTEVASYLAENNVSIPSEVLIPNVNVSITKSTFGNISIPGYTFDRAYAYFNWSGYGLGQIAHVNDFKNFGRISKMSYNSFIGFTTSFGSGSDYDEAGYYAYNPTGTLRLVYHKVSPDAPKTEYVTGKTTLGQFDDEVQWTAADGGKYNYYPVDKTSEYDATYLARYTAEGYEFTGWADENGSTVDFSAPVTTDVTLYAQYSVIDENNDDIPDMYQKTITYRVSGGCWEPVTTTNDDGTAKTVEEIAAEVAAASKDITEVVTFMDDNGEPTLPESATSVTLKNIPSVDASTCFDPRMIHDSTTTEGNTIKKVKTTVSGAWSPWTPGDAKPAAEESTMTMAAISLEKTVSPSDLGDGLFIFTFTYKDSESTENINSGADESGTGAIIDDGNTTPSGDGDTVEDNPADSTPDDTVDSDALGNGDNEVLDDEEEDMDADAMGGDEPVEDDVDADAKGVKTGDSTDMIPWAVGFGAALVLLGGAVVLRRREN